MSGSPGASSPSPMEVTESEGEPSVPQVTAPTMAPTMAPTTVPTTASQNSTPQTSGPTPSSSAPRGSASASSRASAPARAASQSSGSHPRGSTAPASPNPSVEARLRPHSPDRIWQFPRPEVWLQDGAWRRDFYEMHVSSEVPLKAEQMLSLLHTKMQQREREVYPLETITNRNLNVTHLEPMEDLEDEDQLQGHEPPQRKRNPRLFIGQQYRSAMNAAEFSYRRLKKSTFIETKVYQKALQILLDNRSIFIIGHSGDGKSTLGAWLLRKLAEIFDADGLSIHNVEDYHKVYGNHPMRDPRITLLDNVFGTGVYSERDDLMKISNWEDFNETYSDRFNYPQFLIYTTHAFHYQRYIKEVERFDCVSDVPVLDLRLEENWLSYEEQREIFRKACCDENKPDLSPELPRGIPSAGFPGRVNSFLVRVGSWTRGMSFWGTSTEPYSDLLIELNHGDSNYFAILIYMVTNKDRLDPEDFKFSKRMKYSLSEEEKKKKRQFGEEKAWYASYFGEQYEKWLDKMEHMRGILVDWDEKEKVWKLLNDSVRLAVFIIWGGKSLYSGFLYFVNRRFLVNHTYMDLWETERHFYVRKHHVRYDVFYGRRLLERFLNEILGGHVREMLMHQSFFEEEFVSHFLVRVRELDGIEDMLKVRNREDDNMFAEPLVKQNINALEEKVREVKERKQKEKEKKEQEEQEAKEGKDKAEEKKKKKGKKKKAIDISKSGGTGPRMLTIATTFGQDDLITAILCLPELSGFAKSDWFQEEIASAMAVAEKHNLQNKLSLFRKFLVKP